MGKNDAKKKITRIASRFFSEVGFKEVSMSKLAEKLNVTKPALYYHFRNKKELYEEAMNESFHEFERALRRAKKVEDPKERLLRMGEKYLEFGTKKKGFTRMTASKSLVKGDVALLSHARDLKREVMETLKEPLRELRKESVSEEDLSRDAALIMGVLDGMIINVELFDERERGTIRERLSEVIPQIAKGRY